MNHIIAIILILAIATSSIAAESLGTYPLGTWPASAPASPYTAIYQDDFTRADTGDVATGGSWTSETDTGSLLGIVSNTMQWSGTGTTAGYVQKSFTPSYYKFKESVKFNTNTVTTDTTNRTLQILQVRSTSQTTATIQLKANASTSLNQIDLIWYDEAAAATTTSQAYTFVAGTDYTISLEAETATSTSANDGTLTVRINDTPIISLTGLDTYGRQVNTVRAGVLYTSWNTTSRVFTFDDFYFGEADL